MRRHIRSLLALGIVALLLAGPACGGGGGKDDQTASIIHRLLLAAGAENAESLRSFAGKLPDDLPVKPPLYPGAKLIVSSQQPASSGGANATPAAGGTPQAQLYFIVLDTGAGRADVRAFYEQALDEEPWQLESAFSTAELDTLEFFNTTDADIAGAVSIARGGDDGRTSILISLQDAGATLAEQAPFAPSDSIELPKDFPEAIPRYESWTVTDTAFFRDPGNDRFLVVFLTTDSQEQVVQFYRDRFEQEGWTVTEGQAVGLETRIDFNDPAHDIQGDLSADRFARDDDFTQVTLQFQSNAGQEADTPAAPAGATPTPP